MPRLMLMPRPGRLESRPWGLQCPTAILIPLRYSQYPRYPRPCIQRKLERKLRYAASADIHDLHSVGQHLALRTVAERWLCFGGHAPAGNQWVGNIRIKYPPTVARGPAKIKTRCKHLIPR